MSVELSPFAANRVRRSCKQLSIYCGDVFMGKKKKKLQEGRGKTPVPCKPEEMHFPHPRSAYLKINMFHFFKKEMSVAVSPRCDLRAPGWHFKTEDVIKICVFARYWHSNFTVFFSVQSASISFPLCKIPGIPRALGFLKL